MKIQTFLHNFTSMISPNIFIPVINYMCSGPYGVPGFKDMLLDWLAVLPILIGIWISSCQIPSSLSSSSATINPSVQTTGREMDNILRSSHESCLFPVAFREITLLSPLFLGILHETIPTLIAIINRLIDLKIGRTPVVSSVSSLVSSLMSEGRMQRFPQYDMYLPPLSESTPSHGLIFIPGYLVSHSSYAPAVHKLSNYGIVVVVLSCEPYRLPLRETGVNAKRIQHIMKRTHDKIQQIYGTNIDKWSVGGHSAGGYAAMQVLADFEMLALKDTKANTSTATASSLPKLESIILWAAGTQEKLLTDLSFVSTPFELLLLSGTEDPMMRYTPDTEKMLRSYLPTFFSSRYHDSGGKKKQLLQHILIKGGNHGGFAQYPNTPFDGLRKIPIERQHDLVAKATAQFIKK